MREGLIVQAGPSPLANAFSEFTRQLYSGPSREEREYRAALANQARVEAEQMQMQAAVQQEAIKAIPELLKPQQVQAPSATAMGPFHPTMAPQPMETRTETPQEMISRALPQAAALGLQLGGPGKDGVSSMAQMMSAFYGLGNEDDMRRAQVLGGHAVNDAPYSRAEADAFATRDAGLKPLTESEWKALQHRQHFDGGYEGLNPMQQEALGVLPKNGVTLYDDKGNPIVTMGGTAGFGPKTTEAQDKAGLAGALAVDPATAVIEAFNSGKLPSQVDYQLFTADRMLPAATRPLTVAKMSPDAQTFYQNMRSALPPQLMAQSGLAVTEQEYERKLAELIPVPGESPAALDLKRRQFENFVTAIKGIAGPGYLKATGQYAPPAPPGQVPPPAAPNAAPSAPASGGSNPAHAQAIDAARRAILPKDQGGLGKSREHVLQRLRQQGIEPPPDL